MVGLTDWSLQLICCAWIVRYLREKLSVLCYVGCGEGVLPPIVEGLGAPVCIHTVVLRPVHIAHLISSNLISSRLDYSAERPKLGTELELHIACLPFFHHFPPYILQVRRI